MAAQAGISRPKPDDFLIAQMTDMHLGFDRTMGTGPNVLRLRKILKALRRMRRQPDLLLLTGDLVEHGENWAYALLKGEMARTDIPFAFALGNHDNRDTFVEVFPGFPLEDGYLQYTLEEYPLRIVMIDTMEPGRHGGAFGSDRAAWLDQTLSEQPERPTLIAMHHPPIVTGIEWMSAKPGAKWVANLKAVIERHPQIVGMISGHIHCHIQKMFADRVLTVSRAVAPSVRLDLDSIDPKNPDGRELIIDDSPGYSLHHWNGTELTSYSQTASDGKVLVRFDDKHDFVPALTMDLDNPER